jgi:hypothetical protein
MATALYSQPGTDGPNHQERRDLKFRWLGEKVILFISNFGEEAVVNNY